MDDIEVQLRFGSSIKTARNSLGISQETLAERADLHRTYISDVERGARNLSLNSIVRLANALGVSVSSLFPGEFFGGSLAASTPVPTGHGYAIRSSGGNWDTKLIRDSAVLRSAAEDHLKTRGQTNSPRPKTDWQTLYHELQVTEIELALQNEELLSQRVEIETSLARFTVRYDSAPVGYFNLAEDGRIQMGNLTAAKILGSERPPLIGRIFASFVAKPDRPAFRTFLGQVFTTGTRQICELVLLTKDRQPLTVSLQAMLAPDGNECLLALLDITQLKQAETAVRNSRRFFESTFDALSTQIAILDEHGTIIHVNAAWNCFAGENNLQGGRGLGDNYLQICRSASGNSAEGAAAVAHGIAEVMAGRCSEFDYEYPCHSPEEQRWFIVHVTRFAGDGPVRVVVAHENITERKQMELKLLQSEDLRSRAEALGQVGGWEFDTASRQLTWTEMVYHLHELNPAHQVTLEEAINFYSPESRPIIERAVQRAIELAEPFDVDLEIITARGNRRQVHAIGHADLGRGKIFGFFQDTTERKWAEALRQREARLAAMVQSLLDAVVSADSAGNVVGWNPGAERLFGYPGSEILGQPITRLIPARHHVDQLARLQAGGAQPGIGSAVETHGCHKDGSEFPAALSLSQWSLAGEMFYTAVIHDLTERQQGAEANARLAAIVESSNDAIIGTDLNGLVQSWNKGAERIFGYAAGEVVGTSIRKLIPAERQPEEDEFLQKVLRGESVRDYETFRQSKDGGIIAISISVSPITNPAGKIVGASKIARDITGRKRAEEQLKVQFSALTAVANAIVITDQNGKIEWVNPSFTKLTGYSVDEAIGGNPRVLKSGQHPPSFYATLWATICTGNVWHGEVVNKRKDGRLYTEEMTITPVRGADGQIAHFVAIKQDVTERRALESQLRQSQKMEAIGTLAGGIAHDFNNILSAMFGFCHVLQEDTAGNPEAQASIAEILTAAERAKELVRQILTFSHQCAKNREVICLNGVVNEAMKFLRASLPAQIKIELHQAADMPAVLADPTQIYQVTLNLVTNALHAMEGRAGRITVSLEPFLPDAAFLGAHPKFKPILYARMAIADTGHGMEAETIERIFEPFFTTKPLGKGTGLGLSVVHGIVHSHDGIITVDSQVGEGTTFRLYFPGQTPAESVAKAGPGPIAQGNGQKVLVVDDEVALTKLLQAVLHRLHYQVTTSNSAADALGWVRQDPSRFDLVITDLTMPEMNGLQLARELHAVRADLPVILASGYSDSVTADSLHEAGICESIDKPISVPVLTNLLHRTLAKT